MNICFISQEYPPDSGWGGIGTYVYEISRTLAEQKHHVHVITRAITKDGVTQDIGGHLHIYRVWPKTYPIAKNRFLKLYHFFPLVLDRPLGWGYAAYKTLQQLLTRTPIDIIEAAEHNADAFFPILHGYLRRQHTPIIIKLHIPMMLYTTLNTLPVTLDVRFLDFLEQWTARHACALTSPSQHLSRQLAKRWKIHPERVSIVPYPINDDFFSPAQKIPSPQKEQRILFIGRTGKQKGTDILIEAFRDVCHACPNARLLLVGGDNTFLRDGKICSFREYLQQKIRRYRLDSCVTFAGHIERQELPHYYHTSDVCVIPSVGFENFPNVGLEAMACGKPVVASAVGGIPEMFEDGVHGVLVPPGDPEALSAAVIRLLQDRTTSETMGKNARSHVEHHYAKHVIAKKTIDLYESILQK